MSRYSEILAVGKQKCRSLVFDFSKLDNVGSYRDDYQIPTGEQMVVYAYSSQGSSFSLEGNGTIITDQAIYIHPSHEDWAPSNRIPLSEICSYLVYQENSRDVVRLMSGERHLRIFGRTVTPGDTTGEELCDLLRSLQQQLIRGNQEDKRKYELTLEWALGFVRKGFSEDGILEGKYDDLLSIIERHPAFTTDAFLVRAENEYRKCDEVAYGLFLERMEGTVPKETIAALRNPGKLFFESYIRDIGNVAAVFMTRSLLEPYTRLKSKARLTLEEAQLLCMLCIRIEDTKLLGELLDLIAMYVPQERLWFMRRTIARSGKNKMSGVYELLLTGNTPSATAIQYVDDIGLTPLHYALMIRNKDLVLDLLSIHEWGAGCGPLSRDRMVDSLYEYVFVASILYDDRKFIRQIFLACSPGASALRRSIRRITNFIDIAETMRQKCKETLRERVEFQSQAFKAGSREGYENYEKDISSLFREVAEYENRIDEYEQMRSEMEDELEAMISEAISSARARESILKEASHPMADHILHLYHDPDALLCSLADTMLDHRVYQYKDLFFLTPAYEDLPLMYYEWQSDVITARNGGKDVHVESEDGLTFENPFEKERQEYRKAEENRRRRESAYEKKRRESAYHETQEPEEEGYQWFSAEAAGDITILKHEYRALVKKYHPDSSGDRRTADILKAIMDERALILEAMSG